MPVSGSDRPSPDGHRRETAVTGEDERVLLLRQHPVVPLTTTALSALSRSAITRCHMTAPRSSMYRSGLWRDNLDEVAATIRMAIWCRGWLMIDVRIARRKAYF
jgi:hypothetical protein